MALSLEDLKIPISKTRVKITLLKLHPDLPGANELRSKLFLAVRQWGLPGGQNQQGACYCRSNDGPQGINSHSRISSDLRILQKIQWLSARLWYLRCVIQWGTKLSNYGNIYNSFIFTMGCKTTICTFFITTFLLTCLSNFPQCQWWYFLIIHNHRVTTIIVSTLKLMRLEYSTRPTSLSCLLIPWYLWPLLLTWFNFNPSMDK